MSEKVSSSSSSGIGFGGLLTVLFIGLKLTGHINWSWWWVLSPLWIGFGLVILILGGIGITVAVIEHRGEQRRLKAYRERNMKIVGRR